MKEKVLKKATVVFPLKDDGVILGIKADKIGKGCWNGAGGGVDKGETFKSASVRELEEEYDITVSQEDLETVAICYFHNTQQNGEKFTCVCPIFTLKNWQGEVRASKEMLTPTWFSMKNLPLDKMMLADREWVPVVLQEKKKCVVHAYYGPHQKTLLQPTQIQEVKNIEELLMAL